MQRKTVLSLAALAFGATLVTGPALAQNSARLMNDGGFQTSNPGQATGTAQPQQQRQAAQPQQQRQAAPPSSARLMNDGGYQASNPGQTAGTAQPQQQRRAAPRRGMRISPAANMYGTGDYPGGPGSDEYAYGGYYDYAPGIFSPLGVASEDTASACAARFRSYDPASGTFLGFDGMRHPCP